MRRNLTIFPVLMSIVLTLSAFQAGGTATPTGTSTTAEEMTATASPSGEPTTEMTAPPIIATEPGLTPETAPGMPGGATATGAIVMTAGDIIGTGVRGLDGVDLGHIADLLFEVPTGSLETAIPGMTTATASPEATSMATFTATVSGAETTGESTTPEATAAAEPTSMEITTTTAAPVETGTATPMGTTMEEGGTVTPMVTGTTELTVTTNETPPASTVPPTTSVTSTGTMTAIMQGGRVLYAVVAFGGSLLGFGEQRAVVPWDAFRFDRAQQVFVLDVDEATLQDAPAPASIGGVLNPGWDADIQLYWQSRGQMGGTASSGSTTSAPETPAPLATTAVTSEPVGPSITETVVPTSTGTVTTTSSSGSTTTSSTLSNRFTSDGSTISMVSDTSVQAENSGPNAEPTKMEPIPPVEPQDITAEPTKIEPVPPVEPSAATPEPTKIEPIPPVEPLAGTETPGATETVVMPDVTATPIATLEMTSTNETGLTSTPATSGTTTSMGSSATSVLAASTATRWNLVTAGGERLGRVADLVIVVRAIETTAPGAETGTPSPMTGETGTGSATPEIGPVIATPEMTANASGTMTSTTGMTESATPMASTTETAPVTGTGAITETGPVTTTTPAMGVGSSAITYENGRILYAVVGFGGFLGIGQQRVAVPWALVRADLGRRIFVADVTRNELEGGPVFTPSSLPLENSNPDWDLRIRSYWEAKGFETGLAPSNTSAAASTEIPSAGATPTTTGVPSGLGPGAAGGPVLRAGKIVGSAVVDANGDGLGKIVELLILVNTGMQTGGPTETGTASPTEVAPTETVSSTETMTSTTEVTGTMPIIGSTVTPETGATGPMTTTVGAGVTAGGQGSRVLYAIVAFGGFLGIGESRVVVPWDALMWSADHNNFTLNVDRDTLSKAPGFNASNLPEEGSPGTGWDADIRAYWQNQSIQFGPSDVSSGMTVLTASAAKSYDVKNLNGDMLGGIVELLIQLGGNSMAASDSVITTASEGIATPAAGSGETVTNTSQITTTGSGLVAGLASGGGRIRYAVVGFGGFLGIGEQHVAVPWDAMTYDPQQRAFILDVDRATLEGAPVFNPNDLPTGTENSDWDLQLRSYWQPYLGASPQQ